MTLRLTGLLLATLLAAACGPDAPERDGKGVTSPGPGAPKHANPPRPPAPPKPPLATSATNWPGVEGRLRSMRRSAQILFCEFELANTGTAPVTIENFSAASSNMITDVSDRIYTVFEAHPGEPSATTDLTQTLAPGESTTFSVTFPVTMNASAVTIVVPGVGRFEGVPIEPRDRKRDDEGEKRDQKGEEKGAKRPAKA